MKKSLLATTLLASVVAMTGCDKIGNKNISTESSTAEKMGYIVGYQFGTENKEGLKDVDIDALERGLQDAAEGADPALTEEEMQKVFEDYQVEKEKQIEEEMTAMATTNKEAGEKFLTENKAKEGIKTTASGLQYKVLEAGEGDSPKETDIVKVTYEGKLLDGKVFDSTEKHGGKPVEFPLNQVIPGWTEGVQLMKKGAKYEFYIPSDLAYGENGAPGIEPNSTLIFTVELQDFKAQ